MPPILPLSSPPKSICLLRLSAIGDVTHVLPIVRTLQQYWPETKITWIIGRLEHQLVGDIDGVEFIVFDKAKGWGAYREFYQQLRRRSFDVFLHMQVSMRANIASLFIKSPIKLGFDRKRAKDYQWLFSNTRIASIDQQHVLDGFFQFISTIGVSDKILQWDIPLAESDKQWANTLISDQSVLVINPSSSQRLNNWRNWRAANYAKLIKYAIEQYGLMVVLTGGPAENEIALAEEILNNEAIRNQPELLKSINNLVGKTSLKQLAALMQQAKAVVAPDTGPAHIGNAMGAPVIGLYVTSNPHRTGPYSSQDLTVNEYPAALLKYEGLDEKSAPWGKRVRDPEALDLITIESVKSKLDLVMN
jgi:heptosyltransferase I